MVDSRRLADSSVGTMGDEGFLPRPSNYHYNYNSNIMNNSNSNNSENVFSSEMNGKEENPLAAIHPVEVISDEVSFNLVPSRESVQPSIEVSQIAPAAELIQPLSEEQLPVDVSAAQEFHPEQPLAETLTASERGPAEVHTVDVPILSSLNQDQIQLPEAEVAPEMKPTIETVGNVEQPVVDPPAPAKPEVVPEQPRPDFMEVSSTEHAQEQRPITEDSRSLPQAEVAREQPPAKPQTNVSQSNRIQLRLQVLIEAEVLPDAVCEQPPVVLLGIEQVQLVRQQPSLADASANSTPAQQTSIGSVVVEHAQAQQVAPKQPPVDPPARATPENGEVKQQLALESSAIPQDQADPGPALVDTIAQMQLPVMPDLPQVVISENLKSADDASATMTEPVTKNSTPIDKQESMEPNFPTSATPENGQVEENLTLEPSAKNQAEVAPDHSVLLVDPMIVPADDIHMQLPFEEPIQQQPAVESSIAVEQSEAIPQVQEVQAISQAVAISEQPADTISANEIELAQQRPAAQDLAIVEKPDAVQQVGVEVKIESQSDPIEPAPLVTTDDVPLIVNTGPVQVQPSFDENPAASQSEPMQQPLKEVPATPQPEMTQGPIEVSSIAAEPSPQQEPVQSLLSSALPGNPLEKIQSPVEPLQRNQKTRCKCPPKRNRPDDSPSVENAPSQNPPTASKKGPIKTQKNRASTPSQAISIDFNIKIEIAGFDSPRSGKGSSRKNQERMSVEMQSTAGKPNAARDEPSPYYPKRGKGSRKPSQGGWSNGPSGRSH